MSIATSEKNVGSEKGISDERITKAINNLLVRPQGSLVSRLETIVERREINCSGCLTYCYSIKSDVNSHLRTQELVEFLCTQMVDYSIPKKDIDNAREHLQKTNSTSKILELQQRAKKLFTLLEKTGEVGELLLYVLIIEVLGFPQLMSKMTLKTSGQMHYHGADGIHFDYCSDNTQLSLYWGESKLYNNLRTGIDECFKSIKPFLTDPMSSGAAQSRDIHLITSQLRQNVNDSELEDFLVNFFDKDHQNSNMVAYKGACLVGFDADVYKQEVEATISEQVNGALEQWIQAVSDKIDVHSEIKKKEIHMFLLPFPSVADFRKLFIKELR